MAYGLTNNDDDPLYKTSTEARSQLPVYGGTNEEDLPTPPQMAIPQLPPSIPATTPDRAKWLAAQGYTSIPLGPATTPKPGTVSASNQKWIDQGYDVIPIRPPVPQEQPGEFAGGFQQQWLGTKGSVYGLAGALGRTAGIEGLQKFGEEGAAAVEEQRQAVETPSSSLSDVWEGKEGASWGGFGKNIAGATLEVLTEGIATSLATAAAGSVIPGIGTVAGGVTGLLAGTANAVARNAVFRGLMGKALTFEGKRVAEQVAKQGLKEITEEQIKDQAARNVLKYATIGATISGGKNTGVEIGSIYNDAVEESEKTGKPIDMAKVYAYGAGAGAAEMLGEMTGIGRFLKVGKGGTRISNAMRGLLSQSLMEGGTEGLQTILERIGAGQNQWGNVLTDPNARRDIIDSIGMGMGMGGLIGGVGGATQKGTRAIARDEAAAKAKAGEQDVTEEEIEPVTPGSRRGLYLPAPAAEAPVGAAGGQMGGLTLTTPTEGQSPSVADERAATLYAARDAEEKRLATLRSHDDGQTTVARQDVDTAIAEIANATQSARDGGKTAQPTTATAPAGSTAPEPLSDIKAQIEALKDPKNPKNAMFIAKGSPMPGKGEWPKGVQRIHNDDGVYLSNNPEKLALVSGRKTLTDTERATFLDIPQGKLETLNSTVAPVITVSKDAKGDVVSSVVGSPTGPNVAATDAQTPAGGTTTIQPIDAALNERQQKVDEEQKAAFVASTPEDFGYEADQAGKAPPVSQDIIDKANDLDLTWDSLPEETRRLAAIAVGKRREAIADGKNRGAESAAVRAENKAAKALIGLLPKNVTPQDALNWHGHLGAYGALHEWEQRQNATETVEPTAPVTPQAPAATEPPVVTEAPGATKAKAASKRLAAKKGEADAVTPGKESEGGVGEHKDGDQAREAPAPSGGNRAPEGGGATQAGTEGGEGKGRGKRKVNAPIATEPTMTIAGKDENGEASTLKVWVADDKIVRAELHSADGGTLLVSTKSKDSLHNVLARVEDEFTPSGQKEVVEEEAPVETAGERLKRQLKEKEERDKERDKSLKALRRSVRQIKGKAEARAISRDVPPNQREAFVNEHLVASTGIEHSITFIDTPERYKGVAERLGELLDQDIQFFSPTGREMDGIDGFKVPGDPDTVYVNVNAQKPGVFLFGHEIGHNIEETHPQLWNAFKEVVIGLTNKREFQKYQHGLKRMLEREAEAQGESRPTLSVIGAVAKNENASDAVGTAFMDPKFWDLLYDSVEAKHRPLVLRIAKEVAAALKNMLQMLRDFALGKDKSKAGAGIGSPGYAMYDDLREVHRAVRDLLVKYKGIGPESLTHEQLVAEAAEHYDNVMEPDEGMDQRLWAKLSKQGQKFWVEAYEDFRNGDMTAAQITRQFELINETEARNVRVEGGNAAVARSTAYQTAETLWNEKMAAASDPDFEDLPNDHKNYFIREVYDSGRGKEGASPTAAYDKIIGWIKAAETKGTEEERRLAGIERERVKTAAKEAKATEKAEKAAATEKARLKAIAALVKKEKPAIIERLKNLTPHEERVVAQSFGATAMTENVRHYLTKKVEDVLIDPKVRLRNLKPAELRPVIRRIIGGMKFSAADAGIELGEKAQPVKMSRAAAGFVGPFTDTAAIDAATRSSTDTPEFKAWFGKSKVVDRNGEPLRLFHGTTHDIEAFDPKRGNAEGDFGKGIYATSNSEDASVNYASDTGPDLANRIEKRAEQLIDHDVEDHKEAWNQAMEAARKELVGPGPNIVPVYMSLENPVIIGGDQETYIDGDSKESNRFVKSIQKALDASPNSRNFINARMARLYDLQMEGGKIGEFIGAARDATQYEEDDRTGNLTSSELVRKALRDAGFDGVIDRTVSKKWGEDSGRHNVMKGVTRNTAHYIAFKPTQLKSAISNTGAYSKTDNRIRYSRQTKKMSDLQKQEDAAIIAALQLNPEHEYVTDSQYREVRNTLPLHPEADEHLHLRYLRDNKETGKLKNRRTVISDGKFKFVYGNITTDDWIERVESTLTPEEIKAARNWYREVQGIFQRYFGDKDWAKYMTAYLLGNKAESPLGALNNALYVAEEIKTGFATGRQGGLSDKQMREIFSGQAVTLSGVGSKLYDFIDSAMGTNVRAWMGNAYDGASPFVVDRHTFRDWGGVDPALKNWMTAKFGAAKTKDIILDAPQTGAVSQPQYEAATTWGNQLTDHLNERGWDKGGWTPAEVQAVGWVTMTKLVDTGAGTTEQALNAMAKRYAFELDFGEHSPYSEKYRGYYQLTPEQQTTVTHKVLTKVIEVAADMTGTKIKSLLPSFGGWGRFVTPNMAVEVLASDPSAEALADAIGLLAQQTAVAGWHPVRGETGDAVAFNITSKNVDLSDPKFITNTLWPSVGSAVDVGFTLDSVDGKPVLRMVMKMPTGEWEKGDRKGQRKSITDYDVEGRSKIEADFIAQIRPKLMAALEQIPGDYNLSHHRVKSLYEENQWKENPNGQSYIRGVVARFGPGTARRLETHGRATIERAIEDALTEQGVNPEGGKPKVQFSRAPAEEDISDRASAYERDGEYRKARVQFSRKNLLNPVEVYALKGNKIVGMASFNVPNQTWMVYKGIQGGDIRDDYSEQPAANTADAMDALREPGVRLIRRKESPVMEGQRDVWGRGPDALWDIDTTPTKASNRFTKTVDAVLSKTGLRGKGPEVRRNLIRLAQDSYIDLKALQEDIVRKGGVIDGSRNVYQKITLFSGATGHALDAFRTKFVEPLEEHITSALKKGATMADFDKFFVAEHAEERNKMIEQRTGGKKLDGSGITTAEANARLRHYRAAPYAAELQAMSKIADDISAFKVNLMEQSGLIDSDTAAGLRTYKHYRPLKNTDIDDSGEITGGMGVGQGFTGKATLLSHALGRDEEATHTISHMLLDAEAKIIRAGKNEVAVSLAKMAERFADPKFWTVNHMKAVKVFNPETGTIRYQPSNDLTNPNIVMAYVNGQPIKIDLKDDSFAQAITNSQAKGSGAVLEFFRRWNKYLAMMMTSLNPEWGVVNAARDLQNAYFNIASDSRLPPGMGKKVLAEILALKGHRDIFKAITDPNVQNGLGKWYTELAEQGGITKFFGLETLKDRADKLKNLEDRLLHKGFKGKVAELYNKSRAEKVVDFLEDANATVEAVPRVAAYKTLVESGWSKADAADYAKNLTVNFNRKGSQQAMSSLYLFFNPAVQGTARLYEAIKTPQGKAIAGSLFALGAAASLVGNSAGDDDKNGIPDYQQLSDWERSTNIILWPHGPKVPLPYGWNAFYAMGNYVMDSFFGRSPLSASWAAFKASQNAFNPIGGSDSKSVVGWAFKQATPTIADPLLEFVMNENRFGSQIRRVQDTRFGPKMPESQMGGMQTSWLAKKGTAALNALTHGSAAKAGAIDINPDSVDFLFANLFPGVPSTVFRAGNTLASIGAGEDTELRQLPFVRRVWTEPSKGRIFEELQSAKTEISQYLNIQKNGDAADRAELAKEHPGWAGVAATFTAYGKQVGDLQKRKAAIIDGKVKVADVATEKNKLDQKILDLNNRMLRTYTTVSAKW